MQKLTPETLTLIIAAIMLINAVLLVAFLIQKIRTKRYQNIAIKWADRQIITMEAIDTNPFYVKVSIKKEIKAAKAEYNQDFDELNQP